MTGVIEEHIIISPIFGLTLLEWVDSTLILGIIIGAASIIISWSRHKSAKLTASVSISLEMLKRFRDDDFRTTIDFLKTGKHPEKWDRDRELLKLMNHFDEMGMFEKDGVLLKQHITEMHGHVLKLLSNNPYSKKLFNEWRKKDPDYYFIHLARLFNDIKKIQ